MFALILVVVLATVAVLALLGKTLPLMIRENRQQIILDGLNGSRRKGGRHVARRSARHARAGRLMAAHRA